MKGLLSGCLLAALSFGGFDPAPPQAGTSHSSPEGRGEDISRLRPGAAIYEQAQKFARLLSDRGITVRSLHRSHLDDFFWGVGGAAFVRTEKGVVEVVFFPGRAGAEKVQVTERRDGGRYIYSFEGQPDPKPGGDVMTFSRPQYFIMHRDLFMTTGSKELYEQLRRALAEGQ